MEQGQQQIASSRSPKPAEEAPAEPINPAKVIDKLAVGGTPNVAEADAALSWLLADEPDDGSGMTEIKQINVGLPGQEQWIDWEIRPVDTDLLRSLQQSGNRQMRRAGGAQLDMQEYELRVVVAGTVSPDLAKAAKAKGLEAPDPAFGPMQIVAHRFRNKPGLITQLAGAIMDISGFDDADLRDAKLVKAAGNS